MKKRSHALAFVLALSGSLMAMDSANSPKKLKLSWADLTAFQKQAKDLTADLSTEEKIAQAELGFAKAQTKLEKFDQESRDKVAQIVLPLVAQALKEARERIAKDAAEIELPSAAAAKEVVMPADVSQVPVDNAQANAANTSEVTRGWYSMGCSIS